jgi:hypothetical protein
VSIFSPEDFPFYSNSNFAPFLSPFSVRPSVHPSVCPSVRPSIRPVMPLYLLKNTQPTTGTLDTHWMAGALCYTCVIIVINAKVTRHMHTSVLAYISAYVIHTRSLSCRFSSCSPVGWPCTSLCLCCQCYYGLARRSYSRALRGSTMSGIT